ncbi:hypothetical protein COBT_001433 [Conglomerata obtusa]
MGINLSRMTGQDVTNDLESLSESEDIQNCNESEFPIFSINCIGADMMNKIKQTSILKYWPRYNCLIIKKHEYRYEYKVFMEWNVFFYNFEFLSIKKPYKIRKSFQDHYDKLCQIQLEYGFTCELYLETWIENTKSGMLHFIKNFNYILENKTLNDRYIFIYSFCLNIEVEIDRYNRSVLQFDCISLKKFYNGNTPNFNLISSIYTDENIHKIKKNVVFNCEKNEARVIDSDS